MLASFGVDNPATGFALGIERVLLAMERQGISVSVPEQEVYIAWAEGQLSAAIEAAKSCRKEGRRTKLALAPAAREQAELMAAKSGYEELIYIE